MPKLGSKARTSKRKNNSKKFKGIAHWKNNDASVVTKTDPPTRCVDTESVAETPNKNATLDADKGFVDPEDGLGAIPSASA